MLLVIRIRLADVIKTERGIKEYFAPSLKKTYPTDYAFVSVIN